MKNIVAVVATLASLLIAQPLFAQATRTWISGVGDDANPCSRTAPCKTWAGALSKTANNGEINAIDAGGFGAVTITKSITLSGDATMAGVLVAATNGITVNAAATDTVHLRNIVLDGLGSIGGSLAGVKVLQAGLVTLENLQIFGFSTHGVEIAPAASAGSPPLNVSLHNVKIRQSTDSAAPLVPAVSGVPTASGLQANGTLRNVVVSASDLHIQGMPGVATIGVHALGSASVDLHSSRINFTSTAGVAATGASAVVRLSDTSVNGNAVGLSATAGGQIVSYNNNRLRGNTVDGAPTSTVYLR
jgi:hypothetical protein